MSGSFATTLISLLFSSVTTCPSLLLFRETPPCFAAFHRVKYIDKPVTGNVIQDFEQIGVCVKADKQMLIITIPLYGIRLPA
jgi:hypothetical protein